MALGEFPEELSDRQPPPAPPTTPPGSTATTVAPGRGPIVGPIADAVFGNRVLLIGDTVLASTAPRNDGLMCDVLVDFGWVAEIDAEPGRFIEFAQQVLDERLDPGDGEQWDAAALLLGNHFDGDLEAYTRQLEAVLGQLAPRPTIVYTLSELSDDAVAINEIIRALPRAHPNVVVVDWAAATEVDTDLLLKDGGPALTDEGSRRLVLFTAAALGKPLSGDAGECLPSPFTDDTAIVL